MCPVVCSINYSTVQVYKSRGNFLFSRRVVSISFTRLVANMLEYSILSAIFLAESFNLVSNV